MNSGKFLLVLFTIFANLTDALISRILMDAGSTSTRIYLFLYSQGSDFQMIKLSSVRPGIATFVGKVGEVLPRIHRKMLRALEYVDSSEIDTYLYATGGMRNLPLEDQTSLLNDFMDEFEKLPGPFRLKEAATISGLAEAWNTLVGVNFVAGKKIPVGVLDLGGASTEIVIPTQEIDICGQRPDDVIAHSFSGLGGDSVRESFLKRFENQSMEESPCFLPGDQQKCYDQISSFVNELRTDCIGGACLPSSTTFKVQDFEFYAVSLFYYVYDFLEHFGLPKDANLLEFTLAAQTFCQKEISSLNETRLTQTVTPAYKIPHRCFEANYILVLLREVYGFPLEDVRVHFVEQLDGKYLEWITGVFVQNVMCHKTIAEKSEL